MYYDSTTAKLAPHVESSDLTQLRGALNPKHRVHGLLQNADKDYEPVWFVHPGSGRRINGWLVAVDGDGNGRVEVGDGEYAIVTPDDIHRVGEREDRVKLQARLRRVIGQVQVEEDGLRADFNESSSLYPLDNDVYLCTLRYATTIGVPSDDEISLYIERHYKDAKVVEIDNSMPGRVGLVLHMAKLDLDNPPWEQKKPGAAEEEEKEDGEKEADIEKVAAGFWDNAPRVDTPEAAEALMKHGGQRLVAEVLRSYMEQGGAEAVAKTGKNFNTQSLLRAAMPVVQRSNPRLWKQVAQVVNQNSTPQVPNPNSPVPNPTPGAPQQSVQNPAQPGAVQNNSGMSQQQMDDVVNKSITAPNPNMQDDMDSIVNQSVNTPAPTPQVSPGAQSSSPAGMAPEQAKQMVDSGEASSWPDSVKQKMMEELMGGNAKLSPPAGGGASQGGVMSPEGVNVGPKKSSRSVVFGTKTAAKQMPEPKHETLKDIPPTAFAAQRTMVMNKMARRGDYIVANVEWDPKVFSAATEYFVKNAVVSFVNQRTTATTEGANFGITGRIRILAFDLKKGKAQVSFSSEHQGPAALEVVTSK